MGEPTASFFERLLLAPVPVPSAFWENFRVGPAVGLASMGSSGPKGTCNDDDDKRMDYSWVD